MGVGSDSHRSSSEDRGCSPSDGGPQCDDDRVVEQNLEEHDYSTGAASLRKEKRSSGSDGKGAKARVSVLDDQAPDAGAKARRGRHLGRKGRKRPRKRVREDEEEEVLPQRKRRGSAVELGDGNFIKKEIPEKSDEKDVLSKKKKPQGETDRRQNVIMKREIDEEAEEAVAGKRVEQIDEKKGTTRKKKRQIQAVKMGKVAGKRGRDEEDEGVLEDESQIGEAEKVGDSRSSRRRSNKKSKEEEVPSRRRGQGKVEPLDMEITKKKRKAGNVKVGEALEETEQETDERVIK